MFCRRFDLTRLSPISTLLDRSNKNNNVRTHDDLGISKLRQYVSFMSAIQAINKSLSAIQITAGTW